MKTYILILALLFLISCRETTISEKKDFVKEEEKQSKILNTPFSKNNIFGKWCDNQNHSQATFEITEDYFRFLNQETNGNWKYEINDNKINVYHSKSEMLGLIKKAKRDSLVIYWSSGEQITYTRYLEK